MQMVESYALHPGQCRFCGAARPGPVLDTLLEFDDRAYDGRIYICHECITNFWSMLLAYQENRGLESGVVSRTVYEEALRGQSTLAAENERLRTAVDDGIRQLLDVIPLVRPKETEPDTAVPTPEQPKKAPGKRVAA